MYPEHNETATGLVEKQIAVTKVRGMAGFDSFWKRHSLAVVRTSGFMKSAIPRLPANVDEPGPAEMSELLTSGLSAVLGRPAPPLDILLTLLKAGVLAHL